jgi:hypothetical protein
VNERKNCMTPECDRPLKCRGLCGPCHQAFYEAKRNGEVTDEEAVKIGLVLPARHKGPASGLFLSALRSKTREVRP